jgi:outer membrane protein OmpA-like peptidoglycan-associated protein
MKRALLAATLLALPIAARAQPVNGLYVGAGAGANFMTNEKVTQPGVAGARKYPYDTGYVGIGSIGWGFGNGLRLEAEGDFRYNKVDAAPRLAGTVSQGGRERKYGGMANALFDFDIGSPYIFPYAGVGVGAMDIERRFVSTNVGGAPVARTDSDDRFAYQGIVGLSFPIPPVVGLSATIEYRYLGTEDVKDRVRVVSASGVALGPQKVVNDHNQSALIGLRYAFNVVPPAAPPAPAPQAVPAPAADSRTYLVFFDWDRADLSARARQIIGEAASASTRIHATRIEVNGNADRSGTPAYNQGLSQRRAEAVAAELVRDGVQRSAIEIHAYGDTRPLVPTAAGVREPQNRRVEIIFHE